VESKDDKLKEAYLKVKMLQERKYAIQKELESIDQEIKDILSKESLMAFDSVKNVYLLNVNFRA
jgi:peptidoglycan hydrolase CwlO-like protein